MYQGKVVQIGDSVLCVFGFWWDLLMDILEFKQEIKHYLELLSWKFIFITKKFTGLPFQIREQL